MSTVPFPIRVPEQKLERLRQKLAFTDYPSGVQPTTDNSWKKGVPVSEIKRLAEYWQTNFDWRKIESELNVLPQFQTTIDVDGFGSYKIHHVHKKSGRADAIPLLFLHGWPGSFLEVSKMLDKLVEGVQDGPRFHVVAPSLIDFGFSDGSGKAGFGFEQHAEAYDKLMQSLGYSKYVVQAGDVGSIVSRHIAKQYGPSRCKAHHTNTPWPSAPNEKEHPELYAQSQREGLTEDEQAALGAAARFQADGSGYFQQQSTRPLTIGYSLRDSPVGLLSWMYEKMHDWSDSYAWTDDEILTWVSIYYFSTAGPEASCNVYYDMQGGAAMVRANSYTENPLGISRFAQDSVTLPKLWLRTMGPVVFESKEAHGRGGHFAAWENADAMVGDLREMFRGGLEFGNSALDS